MTTAIDSYPARTKVGYGLAHTLDRDSKLAAVTAGYGDGYRRALAVEAMCSSVAGVSPSSTLFR